MRFFEVARRDSSGGRRHGVRNEHDAEGRGAELFGLAVAARWAAVKRSGTEVAGTAAHLAGGGAAGMWGNFRAMRNFRLR